MITKRIIPCLDVRDGRVVKGVKFQGLSDVSSPVELARYYTGCGADELVFYDITASAEGRALFTGILLFKVTDGILFGERKAMIAFVQRIIVRQCLITFLKPNFVILVIEYHSYFFPCDGER